MKTKSTIAALFLAAAFLTPIYANTTLTSVFSSSSPGTITFTCAPTSSSCNTFTVGASGLTGILPNNASGNTAPTTLPNNGSSIGVAVDTSNTSPYSVGKGDLGLAVGGAENGEIPITDGLVLDFSTLLKDTNLGTLNSITFTVQPVVTSSTNTPYWGLYQTNNAITSVSGASLVNATVNGTSGKNATGPDNSTTPATITISGSFDNTYILALTNGGCTIDLSSIVLNYSGIGGQTVPEPGTFVMAGMALVGLGVAMKKRAKKA